MLTSQSKIVAGAVALVLGTSALLMNAAFASAAEESTFQVWTAAPMCDTEMPTNDGPITCKIFVPECDDLATNVAVEAQIDDRTPGQFYQGLLLGMKSTAVETQGLYTLSWDVALNTGQSATIQIRGGQFGLKTQRLNIVGPECGTQPTTTTLPTTATTVTIGSTVTESSTTTKPVPTTTKPVPTTATTVTIGSTVTESNSTTTKPAPTTTKAGTISNSTTTKPVPTTTKAGTISNSTTTSTTIVATPTTIATLASGTSTTVSRPTTTVATIASTRAAAAATSTTQSTAPTQVKGQTLAKTGTNFIALLLIAIGLGLSGTGLIQRVKRKHVILAPITPKKPFWNERK